MTEAEIKRLQEALIGLDYDLGPYKADGVLGRYTTNAIAKFQRDHDLDIRWPGTIGPKTLAALGLAFVEEPSNHSDPVWIIEAKKHLGLHEVRDDDELDKMLDLDTSEIPWCGAFQAYCIATPLPSEPLPNNPLWARNWAKFGRQQDKSHPSLGDVASFTRGSGGHVGMVVGHDPSALHILGGNQSNSVSITRVNKQQLIALCWPLSGGVRGPTLPHTTIKATIFDNKG